MKTRAFILFAFLVITKILNAQIPLIEMLGGWDTDINNAIDTFIKANTGYDQLNANYLQLNYSKTENRWLIFNPVDAECDKLILDLRFADKSTKDCADIFLVGSTDYMDDVNNANWDTLNHIDENITSYSPSYESTNLHVEFSFPQAKKNTTFAILMKIKDVETVEVNYGFRIYDFSLYGAFTKSYIDSIINTGNIRVHTPHSDGLPLSQQKHYQAGLCLRAEMIGDPNPVNRTRMIPIKKGVDATLMFAEWSRIQPTPFGPLMEDNAIDQALEEIKSWNAMQPNDQVNMRLRVLAGVYSPQWVMTYAGRVVVDWSKDPKKNDIRAMPNIWSDEFRLAWEDFQIKLAEKYDGELLIGSISVAGQGNIHTEVTWRQYSFPFAFQDMIDGGMTYERDKKLWKKDIVFMMETWKKTPIEMTFNGVNSYSVENGFANNLKRSTEIIVPELLDYMRTESLRLNNKRYSIGNHSLGYNFNILEDKSIDPTHVHYYLIQDHINYNTDLYFQTEVWQPEYTAQLLAIAAEKGVSLVELTQGLVPKDILTDSVQTARQAIKNNVVTSSYELSISDLNQKNLQKPLVYPNPIKGNNNLHIKLNTSEGEQTIKIFNSTGKLMFTEYKLKESEIKIDVTGYDSGIYFIIIQSDGKIIGEKIIIE